MIPHLSWTPRLAGSWLEESTTCYLLYFNIRDWRDLGLIAGISLDCVRRAVTKGCMYIEVDCSIGDDAVDKFIDKNYAYDMSRVFYFKHIKLESGSVRTVRLTSAIDVADRDWLLNPDLTNAPKTLLPLIDQFFKTHGEVPCDTNSILSRIRRMGCRRR